MVVLENSKTRLDKQRHLFRLHSHHWTWVNEHGSNLNVVSSALSLGPEVSVDVPRQECSDLLKALG